MVFQSPQYCGDEPGCAFGSAVPEDVNPLDSPECAPAADVVLRDFAVIQAYRNEPWISGLTRRA